MRELDTLHLSSCSRREANCAGHILRASPLKVIWRDALRSGFANNIVRELENRQNLKTVMPEIRATNLGQVPHFTANGQKLDVNH